MNKATTTSKATFSANMDTIRERVLEGVFSLANRVATSASEKLTRLQSLKTKPERRAYKEDLSRWENEGGPAAPPHN